MELVTTVNFAAVALFSFVSAWPVSSGRVLLPGDTPRALPSAKLPFMESSKPAEVLRAPELPAKGMPRLSPDDPLPLGLSSEPPVEVVPAPIVRRVDTKEQNVAITFDACATKIRRNGFDRPVYDVIVAERLPATIFVSGRWVETHPEEMEELVANPLIELANHSYAHPRMVGLKQADIEAEIDRTERILGVYGKKSVAFRPPYGEFDEQVLKVARERQLPAVLWDVVSGDPSPRITASTMIRNVVDQTRAGSIVIFHINGVERKTAEALPVILRELRARGFNFVHVSQLLARKSPREPVEPPLARQAE